MWYTLSSLHLSSYCVVLSNVEMSQNRPYTSCTLPVWNDHYTGNALWFKYFCLNFRDYLDEKKDECQKLQQAVYDAEVKEQDLTSTLKEIQDQLGIEKQIQDKLSKK